MLRPSKLIKIIKRLARERQLEHDKAVGKPRPKVWGGIVSAKQDRKISKRRLRKEDYSGW